MAVSLATAEKQAAERAAVELFKLEVEKAAADRSAGEQYFEAAEGAEILRIETEDITARGIAEIFNFMVERNGTVNTSASKLNLCCDGGNPSCADSSSQRRVDRYTKNSLGFQSRLREGKVSGDTVVRTAATSNSKEENSNRDAPIGLNKFNIEESFFGSYKINDNESDSVSSETQPTRLNGDTPDRKDGPTIANDDDTLLTAERARSRSKPKAAVSNPSTSTTSSTSIGRAAATTRSVSAAGCTTISPRKTSGQNNGNSDTGFDCCEPRTLSLLEPERQPSPETSLITPSQSDFPCSTPQAENLCRVEQQTAERMDRNEQDSRGTEREADEKIRTERAEIERLKIEKEAAERLRAEQQAENLKQLAEARAQKEATEATLEKLKNEKEAVERAA